MGAYLRMRDWLVEVERQGRAEYGLVVALVAAAVIALFVPWAQP